MNLNTSQSHALISPMFTGLTRQEQRALFFLLVIIAGGVAVHQWRGDTAPRERLIIDGEQGQIVSVSPTFSAPQSEARSSSLIDLNTATATELTALPGIGEVRARDIVAHREAHGPFARVEDLTEVPGIGDGTLARIRDQVTVSGTPPPPTSGPSAPESGGPPAPVAPGPQLVNVNTADLEDLMSLPGIGEVRARAIMRHRQEHGPFSSLESLDAVPGIGPGTLAQIATLITF